MGEDVFEVGQRVKIIKEDVGFFGRNFYEVGATGSVVEIDEDGDALVDFSESDDSMYLTENAYGKKEALWYVYKPSGGHAVVID